MKSLLIVLSLLTLPVIGEELTAIHRCGGEGPKPYQDITNGFNYQTDLLESRGSVQEYIVWENKNEVIYRNSHEDVLSMNLPEPGNFIQDTELTKSAASLSSLVDPNESIVLTEHRGWAYDLKAKNWTHFDDGSDFNHLFWSKEPTTRLFSTREKEVDGHVRLEITRYTPGEQHSKKICDMDLGAKGEHWQKATGEEYPYIYLFKPTSDTDSQGVMIGKVDVLRCRFVETLLHDNVRHPVKMVHKFPRRNGVLLELTDPSENLLWWNPDQGCTYYEGDGLRPYVLRDGVPTIALFSPQEGLSLVFLDTAKRARIVPEMPILKLDLRDLKMNVVGDRLFLAPQMSDNRGRYLYRLRLPVGN